MLFSYQPASRSASTSEGVRMPLQGPLGSMQKTVHTGKPQWVGGARRNVLRLQNPRGGRGHVSVSWGLIPPGAVYPVCLTSLQSLSPFLKYFTFLLIGVSRKHAPVRRAPIYLGRGGWEQAQTAPVPCPSFPQSRSSLVARKHKVVLTASAVCSHASFPRGS